MITTPAQVRIEGNLPDTIEDRVLNPHITKAVIEIKKIITAEKYAEIESLEHDNENFMVCSIAEANLALAYAIPSLNVETQGSGIVRIKGWDNNKSDLLSIDEAAKLQEYYRNVAMDLLKPFIQQPGISGDETSEEIRGANYRLSAL